MTKDFLKLQVAKLPKEALPNHIAIIPNGHRTWARNNNKKTTEAHKIGMEIIIELSRYLRTLGIHTVSVWAMSTENYLRRDKEEVKGLIDLLMYAFNKWAQEFYDAGARIIHLGRKDRIPAELLKLIKEWEEKSCRQEKYCANIAFDYGGHDELLRAMAKAWADVSAGKITLAALSEEVGLYHGKYPYLRFKEYLDTRDQKYPYPDLIIRSSGELRLSGFMPWQSVYSEFYATPELMPDFTEDTMNKALLDYAGRKRTFGGDSTATSS